MAYTVPTFHVFVKTLVGDLLTVELPHQVPTVGVLTTELYTHHDIPVGCVRLFRNGEDQPLGINVRLDADEIVNLLILTDNVQVEVDEGLPAVLSENNNRHEVGKYHISYTDIEATRFICDVILVHDHTRRDAPWALHETFNVRYQHVSASWNSAETLTPTQRTTWYANPTEALLATAERIPTDPLIMERIEERLRAF